MRFENSRGKISDAVSGKVVRILEKARTRKWSGFTLAELIVVVTILAILATVGFIALSWYAQDARDSSAKANVRSVLTAIRSEASLTGNSPRYYVAHDASLTGTALSWAFVEFDGNRTYLTGGDWNVPGTNYSAGNPDWAKLKLNPSKFKIAGVQRLEVAAPTVFAAYDPKSVLIGAVETVEKTVTNRTRVKSFTQGAALLPSGTAYVTGDTPSFSSATGSSAGLLRDPTSATLTWALTDATSVTVAPQAVQQAGAYSVANSLRFDSARSAYLSRTPSVNGNKKTWTWSGWVKRSALANGTIVDSWTAAGDYYTRIDFNANNQLYLLVGIPWSNPHLATSTAVFRDVSAWYHIVWKTDTTQSDPNLRFRLFVNGNEVAMNRTATVPQNFDTTFNSSGYRNTLSASARTDSYAIYGDAYFSDVNFVDWQALDPTAFGETDPVSGSWRPKQYAWTYGTNGYRLDFSSWATVAGLGLDAAWTEATGHVSANNWTPSPGVAVTDQTIDNPTNNFATLNPLQTGAYSTLGNGNLKTTGNTSTNSSIAAATIWSATGKWYWEATQGAVSTEMVGVATRPITNPSALLNAEAFPGTYGIGTRYNGYVNGISWEAQSVSAFTWSTGDVIGVAIDADNGAVYFSKNGTWLNGGAPESWSAKTGAFAKYAPDPSRTAIPTLGSYNGGSASANFWQGGQTGLQNCPDAGGRFKTCPPIGFKALSSSNLPAPAIANPKSQFDILTWNWTGKDNSGVGDNSTKTVNWVNLAQSPGLVWTKNRDNVEAHYFWDSVRGFSYNSSLSCNTTGTETNTTWKQTYVSSVSPSGFTLTQNNLSGNGGEMNYNGRAYVSWLWAGGGTPVANDAGTMASQVSANPTAGFSIVTYSGNWAGWTVGHGLSKAPEFIISKSRNSTGHWIAYHQYMNGTNPEYGYLDLNLTQGFTLEAAGAYRTRWWQNVQPGQSTFTIGAGSTDQLNVSGSAYVAYAFNSVPGYSKFWSYSGNGSSDGPFVNLGFKPRYLMVKRTTASWSWAIMDSARETVNDGSMSTAYADLTQNGDAGSNGVDFVSNWFKIRDTWTATNSSWDTYVYAAFAESPFWWAGIAPATAR